MNRLFLLTLVALACWLGSLSIAQGQRRTRLPGDITNRDSVSAPLAGLRAYIGLDGRIKYIDASGVRLGAGSVFSGVLSGTGTAGNVTSVTWSTLAGKPVEFPSSFSLITGNLSAGRVSGLSTVATSGNYTDLNGRPTNLSEFVNGPNYQTAGQLSAATAPLSASLSTLTSSYNAFVNSTNTALSSRVLSSDSRLTDARTPLVHTHTASDVTSGVFSMSRLGSGSPSAGKYLDGTGTWVSLPSSAGGDMLKSVYDSDNNGVINNSEALGGQPASSYALSSDLTARVTQSSYNSFTAAQATTNSNVNTTLAGKQATLVSGTNLKTVNGTSLLGSGDMVITGGGGSNYSVADIRNMFSGGVGVGYDASIGQHYLLNATINTSITNYLKSLDGYGDGKVLSSVGGELAWVTATTSTTGGSTTGTTGSSVTPYDSILAYADSTQGRINPSLMTVVNLTTAAEIRTFLTTTQTNKDGVIANGTYNDGALFAQTAAWNNVRLRAQTRLGVTLQNDASETVFIFNDGGARNQVCIDGIRFVSNRDGSGYPLLWSTELVPFNGYEVTHCEVTSNGHGTYNGFSMFQYSTGSNSGQVAQNIYVHDNYIHDLGRANEILSQGYDKVRIKNLVIAYNRIERMGRNDQYGFGISLSGRIQYTLILKNYILECKRIGIELVNTADVVVRDSKIYSYTTAACAFGISDDARLTTRNIFIEGGDYNVTERPFYAYDTRGVNFDGGTYVGHQGVDMKTKNGVFKNMTVTVHDKIGDGVSWNVDNTSTGNSFRDMTVSSAGSNAAGAIAAREVMAVRPTATGNSFINVTTIVGKQPNGTWHNDGAIKVATEAQPTTTITNNIFSQAN